MMLTVLATGAVLLFQAGQAQAAVYDVANGTDPWTDTSGIDTANLLGSATLGANNVVQGLSFSPTANYLALSNSADGSFNSVTILNGVLDTLPNNVAYDVSPKMIFGVNGSASAVITQGTGLLQMQGGIAANGLTKYGSGGSFNLWGDISNSLTGPITFNGGYNKLMYNSKLGASSDLTVNGGAFSLYESSANSTLSVAGISVTGATLSFIRSYGYTLNASSLAIHDGSTLGLLVSNDTPDQLVIAGNADLSGTSDVLDVSFSGTQTQSRYVLATYAGTLTGQFDTVNVSGGTGTWTQDYSVPGEVAIVVPEPGTLGVIALALAVGVTARRRPRAV